MNKELAYRFMQVMNHVYGISRRVFDTSLPRSEWFFLYLLNKFDPDGATLSQLAQNGDVSIQSLSRTARFLTEEGLIDRRVDPNDKRVNLITMTDKGKAAYQEASRQVRQNLVSTLESINSSELEEFVKAGEVLIEKSDPLTQ